MTNGNWRRNMARNWINELVNSGELPPEYAEEKQDVRMADMKPLQFSQPTTLDNILQKFKDGAMVALDTIKYTPESLAEIGMAVGDLSRNYWNMKKDNTINADDYFHCKANYEAASRGNIGAKVAELLGDAKEDYWDYYDNQIRKKKTAQEAILDKMHDKQVNETGRQRAASGLFSNSREACHSYRVKGINDKY